ncbi:hypothetical protein H072_10086 [Dactylellina haptotyla CBS 200.50]|uniref:Zn(2)-C6 fungal-type domain-containing protein n=1 Tax=Dactylellina haptotyla (strain CBS 200.50) TaxID=1284197 RepID=S8BMI1_DACHA|nr:hypothetical protein H072_10086 [Dactylellina haptotyla CBS 200.50]
MSSAGYVSDHGHATRGESESDSPGTPHHNSQSHAASSTKARPITACLTCRNRKVKCDKVYPLCGPCSKSGRECRYDKSAPGAVAAVSGGSNSSSAANSATSGHPHNRSATTGAGVTKHGHSHVSHSTHSSAGGSNHGHGHGHGHGGSKTKVDLQQRITRLEGLLAASVEQLKSGNVPVNHPSGSSEFGPTAAYPAAQDVLPVADSHLKVRDGGKTRYIGPLSWISAVETEIDDIKQAILAAEEDAPPRAEAVTAWASTMMFPSPMSMLDTTNLSSFLPTKSHSDFLWQVYVERVHPLVHILHRPTFERSYEDFWMGRMTADNIKSFVALLFSIFYASIVSMDPSMVRRACGIERDEQLRIYKEAAQHSLINARFMEAEELSSLQALTLLISMLLQHSGQAQGNATWTLVAVAFRLGRSMGLHRDPSVFPNIDVVEGELRRRLWYYLFQLELYAIGPATAIPAINEDSYDTRLPRNLEDDEIVDGRPLPEDRTGYTEMSHYLFRCLAGKYYLSSLKVTSSLRKVRREDFNALIREMQAWGKKLEMEWLPKFNTESGKERLAKKTAILLVHKAILVLYYPLSKPKHRALLPASVRENALHAACVVVEMSNSMETDSGVGPFVWFYSSYTQYHAAAIILGELMSNPESKFAERSWRCLDEMFALGNSPDLAWAKGVMCTTDWKLCKGLYDKACATRRWTPGPGVVIMTSSEGYSVPLPTSGRPHNPQEGWPSGPEMDWSNWDQMMTNALFDDYLLGNPDFQEIGNAFFSGQPLPSI